MHPGTALRPADTRPRIGCGNRRHRVSLPFSLVPLFLEPWSPTWVRVQGLSGAVSRGLRARGRGYRRSVALGRRPRLGTRNLALAHRAAAVRKTVRQGPWRTPGGRRQAAAEVEAELHETADDAGRRHVEDVSSSAPARGWSRPAALPSRVKLRSSSSALRRLSHGVGFAPRRAIRTSQSEVRGGRPGRPAGSPPAAARPRAPPRSSGTDSRWSSIPASVAIAAVAGSVRKSRYQPSASVAIARAANALFSMRASGVSPGGEGAKYPGGRTTFASTDVQVPLMSSSGWPVAITNSRNVIGKSAPFTSR